MAPDDLAPLLFFPVNAKGRVIGEGGYRSRATLEAVLARTYPSRRYRVEVRRGLAPPYRPEVHEARAEPGLHVVTPSPPAQQEQEVAQG